MSFRIPIRYIQDCGYGRQNIYNDGIMYWCELQAIDNNGNNVALNKPVTASSGQPMNGGSGVIVNGNTSWSDYASMQNAAYTLQAITIDLGQIRTDIAQIKVWRHGANGEVYTNTATKVSADGVNWVAISSGDYVEPIDGKTYLVPVREIRFGEYVIKRGESDVTIVRPTGAQTRQAMGVNIVDMTSTVFAPIQFQKGDTCVVYGELYKINVLPTFKKINESRYEYTLKLEHEFYSLQDIKYKAPDSEDNLTKLKFNLIGDALAHMQLLIRNANLEQEGWTLGVVDATIAKNISYNAENLLQVLNRLASEFDLEYWIENKTIHLTKRTGSSGLRLGYGKGKGFLSGVTKTNKDDSATIFTRLYVEGGSQNLPVNYRNGATALLLPESYPYIQDDALVAKYGVIEAYQSFEEIFPKRVGTVSQVGDELTFYDASINFDVNSVLLPGVTAKVSFQDGLVAGYEFEISSFDNATKKFIINEIDEQASSTGKLPTTVLKPAVGDKYILIDIQMPESDVTDSQNDLLVAAQAHYTKGSDISYNDKYTANCDPIYFKKNNVNPVLGLTVNLFEEKPPIDVDKRIATIKRDLQNEWLYDLEFTDKIELSEVARNYAERRKTDTIIAGVIGGNGSSPTGFLGTLSGANGYLYIQGVKSKAGFADVSQDAIHAFNADFALVSDTARQVISPNFTTGFLGVGHRLVDGILELDSIIARKGITAYELSIMKVKSIGGNFTVSDGIKLLTVYSIGNAYGDGLEVWQATIDTDEGTISVPFEYWDIIRCLVFNSRKQKYYVARVRDVSPDVFNFQILEGGGIPTDGDEVVQMDSLTNPDRKGVLYLTNRDSGAPYLDVAYGWYTDPANRTKVRLGRLDGIVDADFGALTGFGLYGDEVYITNAKVKGEIIVTGGNAATTDQIDDLTQQIIDLDAALNSAGNDNILKATEKQRTVKPAYDDAANEVEDYKTQAQQLGVDSTAYNNAFYSVLQPYVSPLIADLNTQSAVDGNYLRQVFRDYGIQKSLLIKAMQLKQKELTDKIQVGGKNYFRPSTTSITSSNGIGITRTSTGFILAGNGVDNVGHVRIGGVIKSNGFWTFSCEALCQVAGWGFSVDICDANLKAFMLQADTAWIRIEHTVEVTNYGDGSVYNFVDIEGLSNQTHYFRNVMIEKGNKASDYRPADEDVAASIESANTAANNAQITANSAIANANYANALLADLTSDNKLTAVEKQQWWPLWAAIYDNYPKNTNQADLFGVNRSAYDAAYNAAYNLAQTYLNDLQSTSDIDGSSYRTTWRNYYAEEVTLLNAITLKAKQLADNAQSTANINAGNIANLQSAQSSQNAAILSVQNKTNNLTYINGGVVNTNVLLIGDGNTNTGFISGVIDNGWPSIVLGVDPGGYANKNAARFRVALDGSLTATGANITGTIYATSGVFNGTIYATDGSFTGTINAPTGYIGGFTISGNALVNRATDSRILFEGIDGGASYLRINDNSNSPMLSIRTDTANRTGIAIQTYASGAKGLSITANSGSSLAINSFGGHMFGQRAGETWNAPGTLGSVRVFIGSGSSVQKDWSIASIAFSVSKPSANVLRVTHNLGHGEYIATATTGGNPRESNYAAVTNINEQNNYVDITVSPIYGDTFVMVDFSGRNKW